MCRASRRRPCRLHERGHDCTHRNTIWRVDFLQLYLCPKWVDLNSSSNLYPPPPPWCLLLWQGTATSQLTLIHSIMAAFMMMTNSMDSNRKSNFKSEHESAALKYYHGCFSRIRMLSICLSRFQGSHVTEPLQFSSLFETLHHPHNYTQTYVLWGWGTDI